jgi:hypothetical protein
MDTDRPSLAIAAAAIAALVVILIAAASLAARRAVAHDRLLDQQAIAAQHAGRESAFQLAPEQPPAARDPLAEWLQRHEDPADLRSQTLQLRRDMAGVERRIRIRASLQANRLALKLGYAGLRDLESDLLIDAARFSGQPQSAMSDSQVGFPADWDAELRALLTESEVSA